MQNLAEVHLWGQIIGALAYDPASKVSTFEYTSNWIRKKVEIAPVRMPLSPQKFSFPHLNTNTYKGLPAVFSDTLPDDFGNAVINAWLARNGRDVNSFTPLERLLYSGNRGMGALEFAPAIKTRNNTSDELELNSLVKMAQQILDQRANHLTQIFQPETADSAASINRESSEDSNENMSALFQVGTSAGGARAKALVAVNKDRSQIRSGQVPAPKGFEHYLLKFDGIEEHTNTSEIFGDPKGYGRMEYAYYLMAKDAGINISNSELLIDGNRAHFMTLRFDRSGNEKYHFVSLCAMDHADYKKPGSYSYEQCLSVARQLKLPRKDATEIFRRMVFNVVARNHDDHTKNTGFLLNSANSQWRLSPAYDLAYSYKVGSPWVNSHQMSINGKRDNFTRSDLLTAGSLIGNFKKESNQIIEQVIAVVSEWKSYAEECGVFDSFSQIIYKNLRLKL